MMKKNSHSDRADEMVAGITGSKKYRPIGIPQETILDLYNRELKKHGNPRQALEATREKLHHVTALYLGDPDYAQAAEMLNEAAGDDEQIKNLCQQVMQSHISTRERLPILSEFYHRLFSLTGKPETILDLACGLNPFALPWMDLPKSVRYYAFDLHQPRIALINRFFEVLGMEPLGCHVDVLVNTPQIRADVAFLFKEAHRMEQRQKGCSLPFWKKIDAKWLLVSLPTASMSGRHSLVQKHRQLMADILEPVKWKMQEIMFENEIVFCIQKD